MYPEPWLKNLAELVVDNCKRELELADGHWIEDLPKQCRLLRAGGTECDAG